MIAHPDRPEQEAPSQVVLERFWAKVNKAGPLPPAQPELGPCWLWTGASGGNRGRYGKFRVGRRHYQAHRFSLILASDEEPTADIFACHKCDNPPCVNPSHLFWGTNSDNQRDAGSKGLCWMQKTPPVGERNANAKLTAPQVAKVRERRAAGESRSSIAEELGISYHTVRLIEIGRLWKESA